MAAALLITCMTTLFDRLNFSDNLSRLKTHLHVYEEVLNTRETDALSRNSWNAMEIMSKMCADFVKLG